MATKHISMDVVGFDKVRKSFNLLPMKLRDRVMVGAVRQGATEFKKRMAWMAPKEFGFLRDSIISKVVQVKGGTITLGYSRAKSKSIPVPKSVRWTKTGTVNPAKYAHLTNMGDGAKKSGWRERAFTLGKGMASKRFETFLIRGLRRESKKLGFKGV